MIASLNGIVGGRTGNAVIIDVNGVGYLVHSSAKTLENLGGLGSNIRLLTVTQVREDAITLYGFQDEAEQALFLLLTSVQGVGASIGLALLSNINTEDILKSLITQNKTLLLQAKGVGPKLATRIVTELSDKAKNLLGICGLEEKDIVTNSVEQNKNNPLNIVVALTGENEARQNLGALGFSRVEIDGYMSAMRTLSPVPQTTKEIVSACLRISSNRYDK